MTVRISFFTRLTPNKPILYVLLIENVLGKLPVDPVGAGTVPHCLQNAFQGDSFVQQTRGWKRLPDVVCQLVGNGIVPRHVFKSGNMFKLTFGNTITSLRLLCFIIYYYFAIIYYYFLLCFRPFSSGFESEGYPIFPILFPRFSHFPDFVGKIG